MIPRLSTALKSALFAVALSALACAALAETVTLRFVQTNDIDRMEEHDGRGGFAKLAAVVKRERAEGQTFFVHSGDTLSPSLLSGIDKGAHIDRHPEPHGRRRDDAGQPRVRFRRGEFPHPHRRGEVPDRHLQRARAGRRASRRTPSTRRSSTSASVKIGFYGLTTADDAGRLFARRHHLRRRGRDGAGEAGEALKGEGADFVVAVVHSGITESTWSWRAKGSPTSSCPATTST